MKSGMYKKQENLGSGRAAAALRAFRKKRLGGIHQITPASLKLK
jgi:hypothetical protein